MIKLCAFAIHPPTLIVFKPDEPSLKFGRPRRGSERAHSDSTFVESPYTSIPNRSATLRARASTIGEITNSRFACRWCRRS